jgi:dGTPase
MQETTTAPREIWNARRALSSQAQQGYQSDALIDRARVIHSDAFRRLQDKTQVLQVAESDFHRNRLTHSIEVAQISCSIVACLNWKYQQHQWRQYLPERELIEAIALAHDLGHPPFGHGGEIALNYMLRFVGGFESNAQTLRIVSYLGKYSKLAGMDLTRRAMLGILKYPVAYTHALNTTLPQQSLTYFHQLVQEQWHPPKCFFDEEQPVVNWLLAPFSESDRQLFSQTEATAKHHQAKYKTLDCSIMELADDISYGIHDFEDAIELGIITTEQVDILLKKIFKIGSFQKFWKEQGYAEVIHPLQVKVDFKRYINRFIDYLIDSINLQITHSDFEDALFRLNARLTQEAYEFLAIFKQLVWDQVITVPHSQQIVKNGQLILCYLFDALQSEPFNLLPKNTQIRIQHAKSSPQRVIGDYVSGMTNSYTTKMFKRIFGAEFTSIFET